MSRCFDFKPFTAEYWHALRDALRSEARAVPAAAPLEIPEDGADRAPWLLTPAAIAASLGLAERRQVH
ncbi:MAG: hypothetical protein ACK47B_25735 [Armatimonadota bacterium]